MEVQIDKLILFLNDKLLCFKGYYQENKKTAKKIGEKFFQILNLTRVLYQEYIKDS